MKIVKECKLYALSEQETLLITEALKLLKIETATERIKNKCNKLINLLKEEK